MSATASGAQPNGSANAKSREHNQGNQDRKYTIEQKTAVIRVRKCQATAFYEILALEKSCSDSDIKKAYRKLSLLTHPDKNGYDGADEAFKMVSRAFQILSDADKKTKYDQFGGDPDSRSNPGMSTQSPFSGFARSQGRPMYDDEISPEELFNRFFGGGGGGGGMGGFPFGGMGGMGGGGPQFVFNMGGGPGFTVHRMGGQTPRRRPANGEEAEPPRGLAALTQFLPLLLLFILPLLSSLFSGSTSGPQMRFDSPIPPHTMHRITPKYNIDYFINPAEVDGFTSRKFSQLDQRAEVDFVQNLRYSCDNEMHTKRTEINEATGFLWTDEDRLRRARNMPMPACQRLEELRISRNSGY